MNIKKYKIIIKIFVIVFMISICFVSQENKTPPQISVIMPVYNRETFVNKAIESVLQQTYPHFELIIIDDGSKDKSLSVIKKYAQKDKRIKVFALPQNKGVSFARNFGINKARGKYLATMDSDDLAYKDWLKVSVDYMEENPNVTAGFVRADYYFDKGKGFEQQKSKYFKSIRQFVYSSLPNIGAFYRLDFIRKNRIRYNEKYISAEDYDFVAQIIMSGGRLEYVHPYQSLVLYRIHGTNSSKYYQEGSQNQTKVWQRLNVENIKMDKCDTAKQFLKKYPNAFSLFHQQLLMVEMCNQKPKNMLVFKHSSWTGEMIKDKKQSFICFVDKTFNCAYIINEKDDEITLLWEIYGSQETFVQTVDGIYVFKPTLNKSN